MGFSFQFDMNFKEFENLFDFQIEKAVGNGMRMGLNKAGKGAEVEAVKKIKEEFPLKAGGESSFTSRIKKDIRFLPSGKARGIDISTMSAVVNVESTRAVQMIRAVTSMRISKTPGRGAPPKAMVRAGKTFNVGGAFVQKGNGTVLLFRRGSKGTRKPITLRSGKKTTSESGIIPQKLKRIALMLQDKNVWPGYQDEVNNRLEKEVVQAIGFELSKLGG